MRKITFTIDDDKYFRKLYEDAEDVDAIMEGIKPFKAVFTLIGTEDSSMPDKYTLLDTDGDKMNINDLNGYQRGVVLNECYQFWEGNRFFHEPLDDMPCGVIHIVETDGKETVTWEI